MNPSTSCAVTLVEAFVAQGVTDAVLCPGSRSAALAYALLDADGDGRLRLHVRVDERSAGFLALGLAKLSRRPVPVVTTSGTALANLHPAVLEASHSSVPLLVISADRPPELRGTGANQTTDQVHFFGSAVRWSHDLGTPSDTDNPRVWRAVAARACAGATGWAGQPGPVHLNVPMREPLVPDPDRTARHSTQPAQPRLARPGADFSTLAGGSGATVGPVIEDSPRTLVVLGDLPDTGQPAEVIALATAKAWPVVAEPFGRFDRSEVVAHGPLLLTAADWLEQHRPERVLVAGRPTLARAVAQLLRDDRTVVDLVTAQQNWPDPCHVARAVYPWPAVPSTLRAAAQGPSPDRAWLDDWQLASARVADAVGGTIRHSWPSGLAVADVLMSELPTAATLFVGSSNPARDVDLAMDGGPIAADVTVVGNRGLAGIDGCVSTAVGIALSTPERAAYALMGDLTFLHDSNGLLIGPGEPRPDLTIVVVNDDGGGIFTLLEPGEPSRATQFERVFGTPTGASIEDLCRAHAIAYTSAQSRDELAAAVRDRPRGIRVVEVRLDRSAHRDLHRRLRDVAATALAQRGTA